LLRYVMGVVRLFLAFDPFCSSTTLDTG